MPDGPVLREPSKSVDTSAEPGASAPRVDLVVGYDSRSPTQGKDIDTAQISDVSGRRSDSSERHIDAELKAIRKSADDLTERLTQCNKVYRPEDPVAPDVAADLVANTPTKLTDCASCGRTREPITLHLRNGSIASLTKYQKEIAAVKERREPAPWCLFDRWGQPCSK